MKKDYIKPLILVEDFTLSDAIAAKNCKYTPHSNILCEQMSQFQKACAQGNNDADTTEFMEFSNLYEGNYDTDNDGKRYNEDHDDLFFTEAFHDVNPGNCYTDPFVKQIMTFGKDVSGQTCIQYKQGDGGDTSLLQNS